MYYVMWYVLTPEGVFIRTGGQVDVCISEEYARLSLYMHFMDTLKNIGSVYLGDDVLVRKSSGGNYWDMMLICPVQSSYSIAELEAKVAEIVHGSGHK